MAPATTRCLPRLPRRTADGRVRSRPARSPTASPTPARKPNGPADLGGKTRLSVVLCRGNGRQQSCRLQIRGRVLVGVKEQIRMAQTVPVMR